MQYVIDHCALVSGVPDAQTQPPVIGRAEMGRDILEAIMPAIAAAQLEFGGAWRQVEFVVDNQNLFRCDLVKARECGD